MLRGLLIALLMLPAASAWAARDIPADMDVAVLKQVKLPYLTLDKGGFSWTKLLTLGLSGGNTAKVQVTRMVRVKDENDRFVVLGRLSVQEGKTVAVKQDASGLVREIWILSAEEAGRLDEKRSNTAE